MNEVSDFNKFKRAKKIVEELEVVIKILTLAKTGLKPFRDYSSLQETLLCIDDSKTILEIHLNHQKQILKEKGSVPNE